MASVWEKLKGLVGGGKESIFERTRRQYIERARVLRGELAEALRHRNEARAAVERRKKELHQARTRLEALVKQGDDEQALKLIAQEKKLRGALQMVQTQLTRLEAQAETIKDAMRTLEAEVERLAWEREQERRQSGGSAIAGKPTSAAPGLTGDLEAALAPPKELEEARRQLEETTLTEKYYQELAAEDERALSPDPTDEDILADLRRRLR